MLREVVSVKYIYRAWAKCEFFQICFFFKKKKIKNAVVKHFEGSSQLEVWDSVDHIQDMYTISWDPAVEVGFK